jgi:hypothetical protein
MIPKLTCSICHTKPTTDLTNPYVSGHLNHRPICTSCTVRLALMVPDSTVIGVPWSAYQFNMVRLEGK